MQGTSGSPHDPCEWSYERCVFTVEPVEHATYHDEKRVTYGQLVQLHHMSTGKYLCVNRKVRAETEKNCFKVMLAKKSDMTDGKSSVFAVKPLYRVRQEGEAVRMNDQVMFVPTAEFSKLRYLCASAAVQIPGTACYEIMCSLMPTSWTLVLYDDMFSAGQDGIPSVRTGEPVVLFQKAIQGYVSINLQNAEMADSQTVNWQRSNSGPGCASGGDMMRLGRVNRDMSFSASQPTTSGSQGDMLSRGLSRASSTESTTLSTTSSWICSRANLGDKKRAAELSRAITHFVQGVQAEATINEILYFRHPTSTEQHHQAIGSPGVISHVFSNCVWVVENQTRSKGGPVKVNVPYRLRNFASNMYLRVWQQDDKIQYQGMTLERNEDTLFCFIPIDVGSSQVLKSGTSVVHICHFKTGLVLHAELRTSPTDLEHTRENECSAMGWSNAKHLHDVFALVNGAPKLMVDLQWVIRCKNVLWSLVEAFKHNPEGYSTSAFVKQLKAATDALTGLITFCAGTSTVDSKKDWAPVQRHQELLLEQNVHKVVMQVLSCPASLGLKLSELTFKKHKSLHRLCVLCYKLLQAIVMGSPTNARQLSEYIPFMQEQMFSTLLVADTLMEIFKDNRVLLEQLNEKVLRCFVGHPPGSTDSVASAGHNARYLDFLGHLCVCDGVGIPTNQEFICRHLMDETNHRLLPMRLEESTGKILIMVPSEYNFSDQADEVQLEKEEPRLKVVAKKLQYGFGFGRKAAAAAEVRRASEKPTSMPSGLALNKSSTMLTRSGTNLNKLSLPPRDQSLSAGSFTPRSPTARGLQKDKWIDLSTFCNTAEPHIVAYLERSLSLLWNLCVGNNKVCKSQIRPFIPVGMVLATIGPEPKHLNVPQELLSQFYSLGTQLHLNKPVGQATGFGANKVIPWTSIRGARTKEVPGLELDMPCVPTLAPVSVEESLKESVLDFLFTLQTDFGTKPKKTDLANSVLQMLVQIVAYKQYNNDDLDRILARVLPLLKVDPGQKHPASVMACQKQVCILLTTLLGLNNDECLNKILWTLKSALTSVQKPTPGHNSIPESDLQKLLGEAMQTISRILNDFCLMSAAEGCKVMKKHLHVHQTDIVPTLLQLAKSPDTGLATLALKILFSLFSFRTEIGRSLFEIQLLFDKRSEDQYRAFCQEALELKQMHFQEGRALSKLQYPIAMERLSSINERPPSTLRLNTSDLSVNLRSAFDMMRSMRSVAQTGCASMDFGWGLYDCKLNEVALLQETQGILLNMGMHDTIIKLLQTPFDSYIDTRPLQSQAYQFLRLFCQGNTRCQAAVYESQKLDFFTQHFGTDVGAEDCIMSIFEDNYELCTKVDEHLVTIHVGLISYSEGKSKNMDFLKTISVVNGIPLARNQVLILHSLLAHDITIPDSINSTLDVWTIETIVAIVELLALCSVGHHAEVARIVRQYLPLESVLGVLADTETPLPYEQQVPFMKYLVEAWWNQEPDPADYQDQKFRWAIWGPWWAVVQAFHDFIVEEIMPLGSGEQVLQEADVKARVHYLFDGVVYCLSEYCRQWWQCSEDDVPGRLKTPLLKIAKAVIAAQLQFNSYGAAQIMTKLVQNPSRLVVEHALQFGIALLHGGNTEIQDALLRHFETKHSNFFNQMVTLLRRYAVVLKQPQPLSTLPLDTITSWSSTQGTPAQPVLRLLQLLCEGHHLGMQNLVRSQKDTASFDMVNEVIILVREMLSLRMNTRLLDTIESAFNTLTEFCQGPCNANQSRMVDCNICHEANKVFKLTPNNAIDENTLFDVKSAVVIMLLSLLEGCRERSRPATILGTLDMETIKQNMPRQFSQETSLRSLSHSMDRGQERAFDFWFNAFLLVYQLRYLTHDDHLRSYMTEMPGYELFDSMLCTIEIARGDVVEKVFFRKPMDAQYLTPEAKSELLETVDRSTQTAKLLDFYTKGFQLMHQLQHQTYVRNFLETYIPQPSPFPPPLDKWRRRYNTVVYPMLSVLRRYTVEKVPTHGAKIWEDAALTLALCVNVLYASIHIHPDLIEQQDDSNEPIFQVFSPTHSHKLKEPLVPATGNPWLCGLVELLGLCTFVASIGICLSLAFVHFPPKLQQYRTLKTEATAAPHQWMHWCWQGFWELTPKLKWYYGYSLLLVPASLLGVKVSPLFFMAHLLILIGRSNVAQNVIEAMTANGTSLLMTLILGMFIVYVFTAIGYELFAEDLAGETHENCTTLLQCFIFAFVSGPRAGGGVGELLTQHRWESTRHLLRLGYDFAFWLVIVIMLLNIVLGITVDTFQQLRTEREKFQMALVQRCFICGLPASSFDRYHDNGFANHIKHDHNMWHYFFFAQHLEQKPEDEFTGQESYVHAKLAAQDISFLPLNKAMSMTSAVAQSFGPLETEDSFECSDIASAQLLERLTKLEANLAAIETRNAYQFEQLMGAVHEDHSFSSSAASRMHRSRGNSLSSTLAVRHLRKEGFVSPVHTPTPTPATP